jgi:hypothetical protein
MSSTTLPDIARSIAAMPDDDSLEALVAQLNHSDLKAFLAGAEQIRKLAASAVKMAESRIVAEQVLAVGELVEFNGRELVWTTDHKRECSDPEQLKQLLHEQSREWNSTLAKRALLAAFKTETKTYMTSLDQITKWEPMAEPLVKDWVAWKDSPPHLKPVEPEGR